jgi:BlaI family penicillinase repressor
MALQQPSELEMQVLAVLWASGPLTVRDVLAHMPDKKKRAYTTILSVLQVMEKKGYVLHTTNGKTHVFKARVKKHKVLGTLVSKLVNNVFGGSRTAALQMLLDKDVSKDDLRQIKALIERVEQDIETGEA